MSSSDKHPWAKMAYYKQGDGHKCLILGHQERLSNNFVPAVFAATELGATPSRICLLYVASKAGDPGFQLVKVCDYIEHVEADGVILTEKGSAVILQTADCPTVILTDKATGKKVVVHAGRAALTPQGHCQSCTIVETALSALGARQTSNILAHVVGDICGKCFRHDHDSAASLVAPFLPLGERVFTDLARRGLNLYAVIEHRLRHAGVPAANISHAHECTYENDQYSSHRRDGNRHDRNHIIVVKTT